MSSSTLETAHSAVTTVKECGENWARDLMLSSWLFFRLWLEILESDYSMKPCIMISATIMLKSKMEQERKVYTFLDHLLCALSFRHIPSKPSCLIHITIHLLDKNE